MTDEQIVKALECCIKSDHFGECFANKCPMISEEGCKVWNDDHKLLNMLYDLIKRQQADKERLEIELQAMRIAANSYKSRVQTLEMDNAQLHSDIVNANQNFDHINGLWSAEKEKVEKAKQKVINICKELQKAKAEIESLKFPYKMQVEVSKEIENEIKSEAVREFAEKLKKWKYQSSDWSHGEHPFVVEETDIDELVIEMTEKEGGKV